MEMNKMVEMNKMIEMRYAVAVSNVSALYPMYKSLKHGDYLPASIILCNAISSICFHTSSDEIITGKIKHGVLMNRFYGEKVSIRSTFLFFSRLFHIFTSVRGIKKLLPRLININNNIHKQQIHWKKFIKFISFGLIIGLCVGYSGYYLGIGHPSQYSNALTHSLWHYCVYEAEFRIWS